jgi:AraC-like DNA-binding protein
MCRLQQLLADMLLGGNQNPIYQAERNWASRVCALLEAEQDLPDDLAGFARSLGMSYESFRKRFTRVVGQPPAKYRMARLIDRACELMQQRRMSDKQIALSLGFCDEFYFSRRFKQIIGQSPRQFRQRFVPAS